MSTVDHLSLLSTPLPNDLGFGLHNNLLSQVSCPRDIPSSVFSNVVKPGATPTNQQASGRCWLFAALNFLRRPMMEKYKLPGSFELSQSYMFFWDKLERVNYMLKAYEETRDQPWDDRTVSFLLQEPLGDGGQWQMFTALVKKYGVVPKDVYGESKHSGNSAGINMVLTRLLREWAQEIREGKPGMFDRTQALQTTYRILCQFMGKPPMTFVWEYKNTADEVVCTERMTPQSFYKDFVGIDLDDYVSVIHDPRNVYDKSYGVTYLGNVVEDKMVRHLNVAMSDIETMVEKTIIQNETVWFGADVGQHFHSKTQSLDQNTFAYDKYLGLTFIQSKKSKLEYRESMMTHAMLITGFHKPKNQTQISRWQVENSWGTDGSRGGYLTMTTDWMRDYVYQVVVNKKFLTDAQKEAWNGEVECMLPPWDPMGALAV